MAQKRHIVVLMGGTSSEHDVSMRSGANVLVHLDTERYTATPVEITRTGEWVFHEGEYLTPSEAMPRLQALHADCVFLALHGPFGEDGRVQGMLDMLGIAYTGSGCAASALAMDKIRSKTVAGAAGIRMADQVTFTHDEWESNADGVLARIEGELGFPCVVKNPLQGSSLGMAIPDSAAALRSAMDDVTGFGRMYLVERFLKGTEVTCGVLDTEEGIAPMALPVTEIRPAKSGFFDYHAKYTAGATEEITPAEIPGEIARAVQDISVRAHTVIGCEGFSRSDMIVVDGEVYWLEVNTIPGFTETSLLPQGAAAAGIPFDDLVTRIIEAACI